MEGSLDVYYLQLRVMELEEKVEQLRLSRRILMNLIERAEREKSASLDKLIKENQKLQQDNQRYARRLLDKNLQIMKLEAK